MKKNSTQVFISIIWSIVAVAVNYIITFCLTPYITENIGTEAYGFVSLAKNFTNYGLILTTALNSFAARFISVEYHKNEIREANKYFSSVFFSDLILGGCILIFATILVCMLEIFLNIPANLKYDIKILFWFAFVNLFIVTAGTAFQVAPIIKNRLDLSGIFRSVSYICEAVFLILVFTLASAKIYYVGIGLCISSLIFLLTNYVAAKKLIPELRIKRHDYSSHSVKNLVKNGIWNSVNSLGNLLNTGLDLLIANLLLSTLEMGQLAIVKTISSLFSTLFSTICQPFQPLLLKAYANNEKDRLIKLFKTNIKLCGLFSNILFAGFFAFGNAFYKLWTPSQNITLLQLLSIITIVGAVIEGAVNPLYYIYTLTLKNRVPCYITILSGIANVLGMIVLIKFYNVGVYGVVLTTAVLSWIVNFLFNPQYSAKCLSLKRTIFYPVLFRHIVSCIIMTFIFWVVSQYIRIESWIQLVFMAIVGFIWGSIIHVLVVLEPEDYLFIRERIIRKRKQ